MGVCQPKVFPPTNFLTSEQKCFHERSYGLNWRQEFFGTTSMRDIKPMKSIQLWLMAIMLSGMLLPSVIFAQTGTRPVRTRSSDAKLLDKFDLDKNGWLNAEERAAAKKFHEENQANRRRPRRRGGDPVPVEPGPKVSPSDVKNYAGVDLYDPGTLRTLFLEFENENWEQEMAAFYHTDVEMPATLQVDGKKYSNVGIQFRGNSSFFTVSNGRKRSMSVTLDHVIDKQNVEGYRAMTLLNAHADPTFLRSVLYLDIVKDYLPAPKANFVRVVINGESWGIYVNQQRYNKDFLKDAFNTTAGVRYKSSNRSRQGGLSYLGDDVDAYRNWYEIKSADKDKSWQPLMNVCKVLAETPADSLKEKLEPIFNIDGALRFLALDIVMQSGDAYWYHGSDYNLYADKDGVLHILHHDANEAFTAQGGSRGRGGQGERRPGTATIDLFVSMDDPNKALRQKLLVVPEFRTKYLEYIRDIATNSLDWNKIGPKIESYRDLIKDDVASDTHKLYSTEQFTTATYGDGEEQPSAETLKGFIQRRREFILNHPDIKALGEKK